PNAARGRRPWADRPAGRRRRREGIVSREQRAWLAARPDHRPIRPRVGDRRASGSLAPELSGAQRSRPSNTYAAKADNRRWSLYGAPWLQPMAVSGKWTDGRNRTNKRKPSPPVAPV